MSEQLLKGNNMTQINALAQQIAREIAPAGNPFDIPIKSEHPAAMPADWTLARMSEAYLLLCQCYIDMGGSDSVSLRVILPDSDPWPHGADVDAVLAWLEGQRDDPRFDQKVYRFYWERPWDEAEWGFRAYARQADTLAVQRELERVAAGLPALAPLASKHEPRPDFLMGS